MAQYNHNIETIDQVKRIYHNICNIDKLLNNNFVKTLIDKKYIELYEEEKFYFKKVSKKKDAEFKKLAEARGLYQFLFCWERALETMIKWGWQGTDILVLIKKMEKAGLDPFSITENTAATFIESLPSHGFQEHTIRGNTFRSYNPHSNQ